MARPLTIYTGGEENGTGNGDATTLKIQRVGSAPLPVIGASTTVGRQGMIPRLGNAWGAFKAALFSPGVPIAPSEESQQEGPRQTQYAQGYNVNLQPRVAEGLTPFSWMINLAELYDTLNMAVLYRQESIAATEWDIIPRDPRKHVSDAQISEAKERLERPEGRGAPGKHRFAQWITSFMYDVLVTDAASVYLNRSISGEVLSWDGVAGDTIKPLLAGNGRYPDAPTPAFQQILYGRPFWEGSTDDLLYAPKNVRFRSAYGHSPVEMLLMTINRALRRQTHDVNYYTKGNTPEAIVPAPLEWSQDQIDKMQDWFDNVVSMPENRRKMHFIPSRSGRLDVFEFRPQINDTEVEKFLDQRVFAILGISPQELGFMHDINRSQGEMQENMGQRRSLPYLRHVSGSINDLFLFSGLPDVIVQFAGEKPEEDKLAQAQIEDIKLKNGTWSVDDVWQMTGHQSIGKRYVYLASGPVDFPPDPEQAQPNAPNAADPTQPNGDTPPDAGTQSTDDKQPDAADKTPQEASNDASIQRRDTSIDAQLAELERWRRYVKHHVKRHGVNGRKKPFHCEALPAELATEINATLLQRSAGFSEEEWAGIVFTQAREVLAPERSETTIHG